MARRRFTRGRSRRRNTVWDDISLATASLPLLVLDSTQIRDGAFSGIKRYSGSDFTVRRTIADCTVRMTQLGTQVNKDMCIEICIGLSWFDSLADTDGQGNNTTISDGTGPLTDADNSRWYARCCVCIPIGQLTGWGSSAFGRNMVVETMPGAGWWIAGATSAAAIEYGMWCHWDTKAMRKQRGLESEFLNIAMEARSNVALAAGDDLTIAMNQFSGRHVLSKNL